MLETSDWLVTSACFYLLRLLHEHLSIHQASARLVSVQVIMVPAGTSAPAVPSGRGVATHGAPLLDGNIAAQILDSQPTWRSVLAGGNVVQAYQ